MSRTWQLPWIDPIAYAQHIQEDTMMLLHSGAHYDYTGRYSFLCMGAKHVISGGDIQQLQQISSEKTAWHENFWVGWLGYGIKNQLEQLPEDLASYIDTADFYFVQPETILRFDHKERVIEGFGDEITSPETERSLKSNAVKISLLQSNMTSEEYKDHVAEIIRDIEAGKYYQANLTRKYFGEFENEVSGLTLFKSLAVSSPASYSAYIRTPNVEVISSSPEQFLRIEADKTIQSRPIKGSMRRGNNANEDDSLKNELLASEKNLAENLMIVDLMRHDFSKVCELGSVKVDKLFEVTTHPLIHHLSSTIKGKIRADLSPMQATLSCFPPGSMTGAPKIRAMQKLSALEKQKRGIYSGAIGWFAGDGSAELSVVIRTIIKQGNKFEFQVGGGIVADSTPESELQETITKALGICKTLGIEPDYLL